MPKFPPEFNITIEKLSTAGEGIGFYDGKRVAVFGALPGEIVRVYPVKTRRRESKASIISIIKPSSLRREPREEHFLTCSPWQIIPEKTQLMYKKAAVIELYEKNGFVNIPDVDITPSKNVFGYRNKMEFSVIETPEKKLSLAFHKRYRHWDHWAFDGCVLAHPKMNECANGILEALMKCDMHAPDIKNIVVRYSYHEDVCIGVVYVTERNASRIDLGMVSGLKGWSVVYSDPLSPAAKVTTVLSSGGAMFLEEEIAGKVFRYRYDGFFQVNPPSFSEIITWLEEYAPKGGVCLDMYAGVGTIGISLSHLFDRVIASEIDTAATDMIQENALRNGVSNLSSVFAGPAEKQNIRDGAGDTDVLIVDPPRSGMHPKVLRDIAETMPPYIIYVSCNPHTQVRDMAELRHLYSPTAWRLFDLYPQTPHVESVLILKAHS